MNDSMPLAGRLTLDLESAERLDPWIRRIEPAANALISSELSRDALLGMWLGHAVHPLLTDLPLGMWTSATVLDLLGGDGSRDAATRLVGGGILAAVPTAVTGLAEWARTGPRERRVGLVHAAANSVALACYTGSWLARRRSAHKVGVALGLTGGLFAAAGGYLGAHLIEVRKVSSYHPEFAEDGDPSAT